MLRGKTNPYIFWAVDDTEWHPPRISHTSAGQHQSNFQQASQSHHQRSQMTDYSQMSEKFEEHESRQAELQRYVQMVGDSERKSGNKTHSILNCVGNIGAFEVHLNIKQNHHHFLDISKCIYRRKNVCTLVQISMNFLGGPIDNNSHWCLPWHGPAITWTCVDQDAWAPFQYPIRCLIVRSCKALKARKRFVSL